VKKLRGGFDNGLGAILIGEHSLASFLSKKLKEGISGLFQQHRPKAVILDRQIPKKETRIRSDSQMELTTDSSLSQSNGTIYR
jgi:hypothetical protein